MFATTILLTLHFSDHLLPLTKNNRQEIIYTNEGKIQGHSTQPYKDKERERGWGRKSFHKHKGQGPKQTFVQLPLANSL